MFILHISYNMHKSINSRYQHRKLKMDDRICKESPLQTRHKTPGPKLLSSVWQFQGQVIIGITQSITDAHHTSQVPIKNAIIHKASSTESILEKLADVVIVGSHTKGKVLCIMQGNSEGRQKTGTQYVGCCNFLLHNLRIPPLWWLHFKALPG